MNEKQFTWRYVFNIAKDHKGKLAVANIVAILGVLASVPVPLLMPLLVDEVLLKQPGEIVAFANQLFPDSWHGPTLYILFALVATLILRAISLVMNVWQLREFTLIGKDIVYRMRKQMLQRLQRIAMSEYETLGSATVASHLVTDLETIDSFIGNTVSKFIIGLLSIVGVAVVLLFIHWPLALFILFMNPAVIYFTRVMGARVKDLKRQENSAFQLFQQSLTDTLDAIHQIRAANRERHYLRQVVDRARDVKERSAAFGWKSETASRFSFMVFLFGFDCFRAASMFMVVFSDLSVGQMLAVFGYLWYMMGPVQELLNLNYAFFGAQAAMKRVNTLLDTQQEPQYPHEHNPFRDRDTVGLELRDIHFAYGDHEPVLNGISLKVKAGEKVALVGASGGGKSTLVQVLLGMYPASRGQLLFDNVPVQQIGLDIVREHVATVLQHPAMFNDSVRMNLTLGREFSDDTLWQALDTAQLRQTVEQMDKGLDTIIGRQGVRLSGGQRQRLAIARMVLMNPRVVILDEATSALDTETEANVHLALQQALQGKTTIIIAHRLSAVKQADRVFVFEDGKIIEEGEHASLIRNAGLYAKLYGKPQGSG